MSTNPSVRRKGRILKGKANIQMWFIASSVIKTLVPSIEILAQ